MIVNEKGVLSFRKIAQQIRNRDDIILFGEIEVDKACGKEFIYEHLIFPGHPVFLLPTAASYCCLEFNLPQSFIQDARKSAIQRDEEILLNWRIKLSERLVGHVLSLQSLEQLINYFEAQDRQLFNFLIFNLDVFQVSK